MADSPITNPVVYVMVRSDLPVHQQIVQVGHAAFNAGKHFGVGLDDDGPNMVVVVAPDEDYLRKVADKVEIKTPIARFAEPDDFGQGENTQMTAFATAPVGRNQGRKLFWNDSLWSLSLLDSSMVEQSPLESVEIQDGPIGGSIPSRGASLAPVAQ